MIVAHKIALSPNKAQATHFRKATGTARFAWNWALATWKAQYEASHKPSEAALRRHLNAIKRDAFPWMLEVTKAAPQQAIKNLGQAYKRFFQGISKYPRFKKKGIHDRFRADNGPPSQGADAVQVYGKWVKLPRVGWVKMRESIRFNGQIVSAVVSRKADRWFVSFQIDTHDIQPIDRENQTVVGVDLGVKALATTSDGEVFNGPKALNKNLRKLKRLQRRLSRKQRGSNNREKAKRKLARLHARIANIRKDALHKLTRKLVRDYAVIGIEDLNVSGMQSNRKLARHVADVGMYEFRRQLNYKADWYGAQVAAVDRWFPSSKLCAQCDTINQTLTLQERTWTCSCGAFHDRDRNAATNLAKEALRQVLPEVTPVEMGVQPSVTAQPVVEAGTEKCHLSMFWRTVAEQHPRPTPADGCHEFVQSGFGRL